MRRYLIPHLAALLAALTATTTLASAATDRDRRVLASPKLWATVNVCDSPARNDVIGIRGSMPGAGRSERLEMRFQVQFIDPADGKWHNLERGADSGWVRVGVSRTRALESGYSFKFAPPAGGASTLRGAVSFRWRFRGRIARSKRELTEAGHRSTRGADPANFSAATCVLR